MHDPTRIPRVLDRLRDTWEGQPDLPLATLFGILANRGAGWGTTDAELEQLLIDESTSHPSDLPLTKQGRCTGDFLVETASPDHRVTLTAGGDVVARSMGDRDRQPSVWAYGSVRPTGPGRMLVVRDTEGIEHRMGVVTLISRVAGNATAVEAVDETTIEGTRRHEIGNAVWLLILEDQSRILLTQRLHVWQLNGRSVKKTTHAWEQVVRCRVGEHFAYVSAGGERVVLGVVDKLLLLES
ncbi:hypothetical protein [Corynebacterium urinipleomorphum]|uniref:hypothetical protein n=1 Tax=Corynebacterium urinipleomorphum TaxID=1852380 RepID=UPI000B36021E|nr:hypothetical protein [Corynebacterium urinipleomorphum]